MYTVNDFETIFNEVMDLCGFTEWYDLYDSDYFKIVELIITKRFGENALESEIYKDWNYEMYADL